MIKSNFVCLEGLRAWMAWWVVVGHAVHLAGVPDWVPGAVVNFLTKGGVAVNVFIMVSGFVITHLILNKNEAYFPYITRRFFRLAPIFIFCTLFSVLTVEWYRSVYVDLPWVVERGMRDERLLLQGQYFFAHVVSHLTLMHGVIPDSVFKYSSSTLLAPAWSLSLEWQFYLLAPILVFFLKKSVRSFSIMSAFLLVVGFVCQTYFYDDYKYPSMLFLSIQFFLIGIVSRMLLPKVALIKGGVWFYVIPVLASMLYLRSIEGIVWAVFMVFCIAELDGVSIPTWLERLRFILSSNRVIRFFGACSYSTYLAHIPIFVVVVKGFGFFYGNLSQSNVQVAVLLAMVVTAVVSPVLYRWVEMPFISIGRSVAAKFG